MRSVAQGEIARVRAFLTHAALALGMCAALGAAEVSPTEPPALSAAAQEVIRMAEAGVETNVVLAYVQTAQTPFGLSAEDIVYLKDVGISDSLVTAMLQRDTVLHNQPAPAPVAAPPTNAVPAAVAPPQPEPVYVTNAPVPVTYFQDTLAPYGTWVVVDDLGWCWRPHVVVIDHSWRPYCQGGRWLWTDLGWYWQSDYSWGWAPFHYGRWHQHPRCGWVWFPDSVWAPAWVSWRFSDAYCGWAPLPPGSLFVGGGWRFHDVSVGINFDFHLGLDLFTFVEIGHLHDHHPHLHALPPRRVAEIHARTRVVNNYSVGPNNRIANHGIGVDRVGAAAHTQIQRVSVRDLPSARAGSGARPDRVQRVGADQVVYRPELRAPSRPAPPPRAQRVVDRAPIIQPVPIRPPAVSPSAPRGSPRPSGLQPAPQARPAQPQPTPRPTPPAASAPRTVPGPVTPPVRSPQPQPTPGRVTPAPSAPRTAPAPAAPAPSKPRAESPRGADQRPPVFQPAPQPRPAQPQPMPRSVTPAPSAPRVVPGPAMPAPSRPRAESPRGADQRPPVFYRGSTPAMTPPARPSAPPRTAPPHPPPSQRREK